MPQFLFSINSNDIADFGEYLLSDYCAVQEAFNINVEEWIAIANNSTDGSWISEDRKVQLRKAFSSLGIIFIKGFIEQKCQFIALLHSTQQLPFPNHSIAVHA
jgi:adenosine deaminase